MPTQQQQLEAGIAALEAQRALLGDAVVDMAIAGLRAQLAALQPAPAVESPEISQILKQVSILFLDVVGSTTLAQQLDPEEVSAVMDGALSRGTTVVQAHRGRVLQYAGDNILAAFGAEEAAEDDAEHAVRCGLELLALGKVLGSEVQAAHGFAGFDFRVGVHTGGVLLGGGVDEGDSIRGIAVNIAARMEQTAPAGALRISQDTYTQVRGVFDVMPQEPLVVKGLDEPIATYLVMRAKPRAFRTTTRGIEGVATRMVGREAELERLQSAFERLFERRQLEMLLVVADAGVGKSRLLYEFTEWAETRPEVYFGFHGRADPRTQSQPFGLLRDVLAWRLQISDTDSVEVAKSKIEQGIAPLFVDDDGPDLAQAHAHLLGHLVGLDFSDSPHVRGILDDPKQIRTRAFHAAAQAFRRFSAEGEHPIVLRLDDLHWSDDGSLEFLNHLMHVNRDVPMLLLCLTRPTLFERRPDLREPAAPDQRIDLAPLDKAVSGELAGELLKRLPEVPDALSALLIARADGNPFYMEELVKMLIDRGALRAGAEAWSLNADKILSDAVPSTLTGILQARLDTLPATERLALQEASVVGMVFWEEALAALDAQAPRTLPALVRHELALPRVDTSVDGVHEYSFKHQILHEVTYETVLKRARRTLHARAAEWFADLHGLRATGLLGSAAWHYERAGDTARAAEYYTRAAEDARGRYAHEAALNYIDHALRLCKGEDDAALALRWRLLDARERTYELLGKRPEQRADLDALQQLADRLADDRLRAEVATRCSLLAGRSGDIHGMESAAREGLTLAERCDDTPLRLNAMRLLADALARHGDLAAGEAMARRGLEEARVLRLPGPESRFLNALTVIAAQRNDTVMLLTTSQQAVALRRALGDRRNEAIGLAALGAGWLDLGHFAQARSDLDECLRLLRAMGDRSQEPLATANLSQLALWEGDAALAREHAATALEVAAEVRAQALQVFALWCLGNAELALGDLDGADSAYARASELARAAKSPQEHDASAGRARVALARGDLAAAVASLGPVLAAMDAGVGLDGTLSATTTQFICWQVLDRSGDPRALPLLAQAHEALQARAAELDDPALRDSFLTRVPPNREIVVAWAMTQAPTQAPAATGSGLERASG
jgi:class 3 adenylate cyclase/tetratricopeptide (TPR) repeat protein